MSLSSLPRPVLLAAVGVVVIVGVFVVTRGKSSSESSSSPAPAKPTASKSAQTAPGSTSKSGSGTTSAKPSSTASSSKFGKLPPAVKQALDQHKVVAILFWRPRGVDDRAVYQAVNGLRGRSSKVRVFTARPTSVERYVAIVGLQGISETPTLVVVDRNGKTDIQSGYVDEKTVENTVFNAI